MLIIEEVEDMPRVTENEVALAVLQIAAGQPNGICTFNRARKEVPNYLKLSAGDLATSVTRPNEAMWHQLIRNIRSHHDVDGNFIHDGLLAHVSGRGYQVTNAGRAYLKKKGL